MVNSRQRLIGRKVAAVLLLGLAFAFSTLAIQAINYRLLVVGSEGLGRSNPIFAQLLERSSQDQPGGGAGESDPSSASQNPDIQLLELLVSILEDQLGELREVPDVSVNVTVSREAVGRMFGLGDPLSPEEIGLSTLTGPIRIASGETDSTGTVRFELPAGNYSIITSYLGLTGNHSITLATERPHVSMRWVFYNRFESPILVQAHDTNGDGSVSFGEQLMLFYQTESPIRPDQLTIIIRGEAEALIRFRILDFLILSNGVQVFLTPVTPVEISGLTERSTLLVGIQWYQVTILP